MWTGPAVLIAIFVFFTWWSYPQARLPGPMAERPSYVRFKIVLILTVAWTVAALFILGLSVAYNLEP